MGSSDQPIKFEFKRLTEYSDETILTEIKRVASLLNKSSITIREFDKHSRVHAATIIRHFGSWIGSLQRAGLSVGRKQKRHFTDEELFENLLAVWTHYGRAPKFKELSFPPSAFGGKPYATRFGSWNKALSAFVERVNTDTSPAEASFPIASVAPTIKIAASAGGSAEAERRDIRLGLRFAILQRDRFRCVACGSSPATHPGCALHVDHILPFSKGGKTVADNLRTLCANCNIGRGNRFDD